MIYLVLLAISAALIWFRYEYWKRNRGLDKFPGPPKKFFVGNAFEFSSSTDVLDVLMRFRKKYGGVIHVRIGPIISTLLLSDEKTVSWILSSTEHITKSRMYLFLTPWLGNGLLNSTGDKWKQRRKIITPTFHFKILEEFVEVFDANSWILVEKLRKEVGIDSVDIYPYVTLCALDIICETAMGTSVNAQRNEGSEYVKSVKQLCKLISDRGRHPLYNVDFFFKFSSMYRQQQKYLEVLHGHTERVIRMRREEIQRKKEEGEKKEDEFGVKKRRAFLDLLLSSTYADGSPLSDLDVREEVDTFMFEGHDTTASAMSFVLYCLANNNSAQEKAFAEASEIFSDNLMRKTTYKDLQQMKYLEMVIKESLRMYPSVTQFSRELQEDVMLDGKLVPKKTAITVFVYGIQRDEQIYPNPDVFDPERFADVSDRSPYAYVPFSAGSRNCIGQKFAMLEMKATVSKILRNFQLLPAVPEHRLKLAQELILKSANGIKIRLLNRINL